MEVADITQEQIQRSVLRFSEYCKYIEPFSYNINDWKFPSHWIRHKWADNLQDYLKTSKLAPRGHLKSSILHAYIRWRLWKSQGRIEKWMYMCFKEKLATMHIKDIKQGISLNPFFKGIQNMTDADGTIKYTWDGGKTYFEVIPAGIMTFTRGWHGDGVICDDILSDPDNQLKPVVINKITRIFFDNVWFLPNPGGWLHVVGTPQHQKDLFYDLRMHEDVYWNKYQAIVNRKDQEALWPERYSFAVLRKEERTRPSSFKKERMCEPVWEVSSFIPAELLMKNVDPSLRSINVGEKFDVGRATVVAGHDIGKKSHPAHFCVFKYSEEKQKLEMIHEKWMDGWEYHKQRDYINAACEFFKVDLGYYDNTRGEFEGFAEQGTLHKSMKPMSFTTKSQGAMASALESQMGNQSISIINNQRTVDQIQAVNGDLDAMETDLGHGDSFWSVAMSCLAYDDLQRKRGRVRAG